MSEARSAALAAKLAELTQRFVSRAADDRAAIAQALADDDRAVIARRAHTLAGNAGMFGHPEIGAAALTLEEAAQSGDELGPAAGRLLHLLSAL